MKVSCNPPAITVGMCFFKMKQSCNNLTNCNMVGDIPIFVDEHPFWMVNKKSG